MRQLAEVLRMRLKVLAQSYIPELDPYIVQPLMESGTVSCYEPSFVLCTCEDPWAVFILSNGSGISRREVDLYFQDHSLEPLFAQVHPYAVS